MPSVAKLPRGAGLDPRRTEAPLRPRRHCAEVVPVDGADPEDESPEGVPGAILRTILDTEHRLSLRICCKRSILD